MAIKFIYVNGDSFSFGQELGGSDVDMDQFYTFTDYMRKHSYTGLLTDKWGVENYVNQSMPGGSNDRIFRCVMTELPKYLSMYDPSEIFVFISLTHASRREFFYNKYNKYSPFIVNFAPPVENTHLYTMWKNYILNFDNVREQADRYMSQVIAMQSFLKGLGINYIFTRSMNDDHEFKSTISNMDASITNLIDRKHFPDIDPFNVFAVQRGVEFGKYQHPLEAGHRLWADYLGKYIEDNLL